MTVYETSTADYAQLRRETIQAHEVAALFESVADIAGVSDSDESGEATNEEGTAVNAYGSPLALWELKRGLLNTELPGTRSLWSRLKWGVCASACEEMGASSRKPEGVAISLAHPRLSSRVDMEISLDLGETWEPMVAKNVAGTSMDMWRNAVGEWVVPEAVLLECQHHCLVRGANRVHVVGLFGGVTVRRFLVERDEELVDDIADTTASFWNAVDAGRRPAANGKKDQKVIARLNATINPSEDVIDLRGDREVERMITEKARISAEIKALQASQETIDTALKAKMDNVASAIISETQQLRWIRTGEQTVSYTKPASAYLKVTKIAKKAAGNTLDDLANKTT